MEEVLNVEGLEKSYAQLQAVKGLSFSVQRGEIFGILGPNGAGKTTSIECILGTRKKDAGNVQILGKDPYKERRELFENVGVQFQDSGWQTGIRVQELCRVHASLYKKDCDWEGLLQRFDLVKRKDKTAESLSGGEKQKLSLLLAFLNNPHLVFLDELTTGLDPLARREVWDYIRHMQDTGTTIILSSHYMDEVEALCSRALILKDGICIASGSISELLTQAKAKNLDQAWLNLLGA